ncbi:hypothetical protein Clacol_005298 [Clathrus columnatus]|uniref:Uncharacterized protein n=1 Tax=Clathrus columnatus TaxID=1419009 RepID=A0AAV5ABV3_9AGAM|nr:hypothetical protein Clacol_005298 [Clathrus columnatus]
MRLAAATSPTQSHNQNPTGRNQSKLSISLWNTKEEQPNDNWCLISWWQILQTEKDRKSLGKQLPTLNSIGIHLTRDSITEESDKPGHLPSTPYVAALVFISDISSLCHDLGRAIVAWGPVSPTHHYAPLPMLVITLITAYRLSLPRRLGAHPKLISLLRSSDSTRQIRLLFRDSGV